MSSAISPSVPAPVDFSNDFIDSAAFARKQFPIAWLVKDCLVADQPCVIGGPMKTLKTSIAVDLAISLGTGTRFLGRFEVPQRQPIAVLSGESGEAALQALAQRVCQSKRIPFDRKCLVTWSSRLPRLGLPSERRGLTKVLADRGIRAVIIDPLYLCLTAGTKASASNLFEMGPLLRAATESCLTAGATPIFVHHCVKSSSRKEAAIPKLDDLAFGGIGEYARQWILLSRQSEYMPGSGKHELRMAIGGSMGHSACYDMTILDRLPTKHIQSQWQVSFSAGPLSRGAV